MMFKRAEIRYDALRKECLDAIGHWPGCETVTRIQLIRDSSPAGFLVRVEPRDWPTVALRAAEN